MVTSSSDSNQENVDNSRPPMWTINSPNDYTFERPQCARSPSVKLQLASKQVNTQHMYRLVDYRVFSFMTRLLQFLLWQTNPN